MSITAFWDKVAGRQRVRKQTCEQEFRSMVLQLADGKEPDAERVEDLLREMGKSISDLRQAVELYVGRRDLRALFDSIPEYQKERQSVEQKLKEADRLLALAEAAHEEATTPLYRRMRVLDSDTSAAWDAERQLQATCPDQSLHDRLSRATTRMGTINSERYTYQVKLKDCRGWVESNQEALKSAGRTRAEEHKERIERYGKVIVESEKAMVKLNAEFESLQNEEREVRRLMRNP